VKRSQALRGRNLTRNNQADGVPMGFMLSDKKAGPFKMEVESIKVVREGEGK
jgi:hypothetical protein